MTCSLCPHPIGKSASPVPDGHGGMAHHRCIKRRSKEIAEARRIAERPTLTVGQTYLWPPGQGQKRCTRRVVFLKWLGPERCEVVDESGTVHEVVGASLNPVAETRARRSLNQ